MTTEELLKLYNPAHSAALTQQQILEMQSLKLDEIKKLALAYPNSSNLRAYLLIIDSKKPTEKQLPQLSTWQNLYNLITKNGMKTFVAFGFRGGVKQKSTLPVRVRRSEVLDLSDQELQTLPGFKTGNTIQSETQMTVTRVKNKAVLGSIEPEATIELNTTNPL